ncbi:thiamine pyrophosphokinase [Calycina marina]|uniref:Thiamine pyrophosphokinase n=1 Tax=Calycina marina TaxID=1763456 RepID=A0A9P7Z934_9HELO|nr:thiamine pyrophosphokinase [Calycina marina]
MTGYTEWRPADLFSDSPNLHKYFALIVLNQPLELRVSFYAKVWRNAVFHVGADGGANRLHDMLQTDPEQSSLNLDTIIGDLDSLTEDAKNFWYGKGSEIIHDSDQYSTDFGKATKYLKDFRVPDGAEFTPSKSEVRQAKLQLVKDDPQVKDVVCLGGLGGRVDQGMATLQHLYICQKERDYASGRMFLLSGESITFVLKSGKHKIRGMANSCNVRLGKHVGIVPIKERSVITTTGLEWDVTDWVTEFGGQISTSNHVKEQWVTVETTNDVLFTIDFEVDE